MDSLAFYKQGVQRMGNTMGRNSEDCAADLSARKQGGA